MAEDSDTIALSQVRGYPVAAHEVDGDRIGMMVVALGSLPTFAGSRTMAIQSATYR